MLEDNSTVFVAGYAIIRLSCTILKFTVDKTPYVNGSIVMILKLT